MEKEEYAVILDFLPNGYPLEGKMMPIAQAIGAKHLTLLQLVPRKGVTLNLRDEVYIGEGKRDKIYYIFGRLPKDKITETAKMQLSDFVRELVGKQEERFVNFFNNAQPINTRLHQLELLPGFGVKHTQAILSERENKPFETFEEIKQRIPNLPDPAKAVEKRILQELEQIERHNLFVS